MKKQNYLMKNYLPGWTYTNKLILICLLLLAGNSVSAQTRSYKSDRLELVPINPSLYVHISYLNTNEWGKVGCNGMVYINKDSAYVFDTPASDTASQELIRVLQKKWKLKIKGVIVNHYHNDCLAGLMVFHKAGISSYASELTIKAAKKENLSVPQHGFAEKQVLKIGNQEIINQYFGEAHTKDNIVSYIPEFNALFGGCMAKAIDAGFGHVGDANIAAWANTIRAVQAGFPAIKVVVPGHGDYGDGSLLDFTAGLFALPAMDLKTNAAVPDQDLFNTIQELDSAFFDAFNRRDLEATMSFFSPDLEFYHDKGGKDDYKITREKLNNLFTNNASNGFRRDLIPGSMEVFPVPGFGAIQVNRHLFCHIENKKLDCGTFKNIMVWNKMGDQWKITRVLSFDH